MNSPSPYTATPTNQCDALLERDRAKFMISMEEKLKNHGQINAICVKYPRVKVKKFYLFLFV